MFDSKKSKTKKIKMYDILITYDINNDGQNKQIPKYNPNMID